MPRALPALLESAMDSGVFKAYIAIGSGGTPLVITILYYKYDGLNLIVKWASPNLPFEDGIHVGSEYYLERGVTIAGVNHTIKSALLRFDDYTYEKHIITAQFSLFSPDHKPEAVSGDVSYTTVITNLSPGTPNFITTPENTGHWDYQFFAAGKQVIPKSYASLLPLYRQKYLIEAADGSDDDNVNTIDFYHLRSPISELMWVQGTISTEFPQEIRYSPELALFVAVTTAFAGSNYGIWTSADAITWTYAFESFAQLHGLCWSPELAIFVAVGLKSTGTHAVYTSANGSAWTGRSSTLTTWNAVAWSSELALFVMVGNSGAIATSPDGIIWTDRTAPNAETYLDICWSAEQGLFVAVGSTKVVYSTNGITWTEQTIGISASWLAIAWSPLLALYAITGQSKIATSPDGITWTDRATLDMADICWSSLRAEFMAVGVNIVYTSPDGIVWTALTPPIAPSWSAVVFSEERQSYALLGFTGANPALTSIESLAIDHTIDQGDIKLLKDAQPQAFLWRDEVETIHSTGVDTSLVHNLGYLESTDDPPASFENSERGSVTVGIHLKYKTGDIFKLKINETQSATYHARVTEILDPNAEIGWRCEIELIERFANTNAGAMPSTIERVAAYTPLVTTNFDGNLDETVNNLQAFADKVDDLVIDATTFNYTGAWSGATTYQVDDVVSLNGSSYICIVSHTNQTPPNATYWQLMGNKGDTGATGATGADGADGVNGGATIVLFDHYTDVGNVGTGEDDLYSDTIAAGQLANNGDKLHAFYGGIFVTTAIATRQMKVKFAGTTIFDSTALTITVGIGWSIEVDVIRVSSSVIRYKVTMLTEDLIMPYAGELTGLTLSNTNVLKITGEAAGAGATTNDIVAKLGTVLYTKLTSADIPAHPAPNFRLSLTSGLPVTTADVTGATHIYLTPDGSGNQIELWDGGAWRHVTSAEVDITIGTVTAGIGYDVFAYLSSGVLACEILAWSSGTARATDVTLQDGRRCKSGDKTRRYVGSFYTTSTTQTECSVAKVFVWNMYNRHPRYLQRTSSAAHNYNTATIRPWNNDAPNNQIEIFVGLVEDAMQIELMTQLTRASTDGAPRIRFGVNSTTTEYGLWGLAVSLITGRITSGATVSFFPNLGYSYYVITEFTTAGTAPGTSFEQAIIGAKVQA